MVSLAPLIKVTIITVLFPLQANFVQPSEYFDALDRLDEFVNVVLEQGEFRCSNN
jgi:hypothetical protein